MNLCQHCAEPLMRADSAWIDLGGPAFCGDGISRHTVANTTVVTASPMLGWLQTGPYVDQWGRGA